MSKIILFFLIPLNVFSAYTCDAVKWPFPDTEVEKSFFIKNSLPKKDLFSYFLYEMTKEKKDKKKGIKLKEYLLELEENQDMKNFIKLLAYSSNIDTTEEKKVLEKKEVCEIFDKVKYKQSK